MSTASPNPSTVGRRTPADHLATARRYAANPDDWPLAPRFDPLRRWYHRLAAEPDWSQVPGVSFVRNGQVITTARERLDLAPLARSPYLEGYLDHSIALCQALKIDSLHPGDGRAFGPHHIHQITNAATQPAVSLHVYGPALREMTHYHIVDGQLLVTAVDRAGADW